MHIANIFFLFMAVWGILSSSTNRSFLATLDDRGISYSKQM